MVSDNAETTPGPAPSQPDAATPSSAAADGDSRNRLEEEKARVESLIGTIKGELDDQGGELADYDQHPADTATDTFEREKDLSILEQLEQELSEVEAALARIDDGSYGVDERTGKPIDPARLDAMPTARTNID